MDFVEYQGKRLLHDSGLAVPRSMHCATADEAAAACRELGPCVIKAQVPIGKRGKAGGIELASTAGQAKDAATRILAMQIGGYDVASVLVEQQAEIDREFYAAVMTDLTARWPLILFSAEGGMEIEELAAEKPEAICRDAGGYRARSRSRRDRGRPVGPRLMDGDIWKRSPSGCVHSTRSISRRDAELVEINPLRA